ncbi:hypothetical protein MA5S0422_3969 [Mycobacteroides abscessus 5S-0422]|uniref:Uncharacterized protein n=1 Tax=Mycobacteroides abscessus subsp. bolletii 1513 TaxID=1299321 RepID=X8DEM9_9MYCO|nr:hypothetical protein MA5S0422_3969 [Mycobacteroides abscessus 5S-0422]EIU06237.1 hypothetical protein MA5S0421_3050 [Mycobacteroides abscessus 5S-0421]EIU09199.1 hypothetical protein MA5S0304_2795 [Mycobacteroides abscessus 5S-0304]EIU22221.1 hypothetical protein MA5S0708_2722 [Mycobacteroides abscessus 5S-0708]EIU25355.1 hypothetical protein MA5S0817_2341 [Mycobacteroides abscessus 5S-0817]EIU29900.1 hypothetical protein MA5S1212_2478 [Mycobacteroides abscessus 5S-1212]EIU42266.1 hypothet
MAAEHPLWAGANERLQDKPMDGAQRTAIVAIQVYVVTTFADIRRQ